MDIKLSSTLDGMVHTFTQSTQGTEVCRSLWLGTHFVDGINHSDQKQLKEGKDLFGFHFQVRVHYWRSEGRSLKQKPLRNTLCWFTLGLLPLNWLPYIVQDQGPRGWYCPSRLVLLCPLIIKTTPHRHTHITTWWRQLLNQNSFYQVILSCFKPTANVN